MADVGYVNATPIEQEHTMNANQIHFGIELETTFAPGDTTPIGPYHHGLPVACQSAL